MEDVEELTSGPPEQVDRGRRRLWPLLLVAAAAGVWFLLPDTAAETPPARPAESQPAPAVSVSPPGYQPGFHTAVPTLESICTPATDGRTRLKIAFVLINRNAEDVEITKVRASQPMAGLTLKRVRVVPGGCLAPLDEPLDKPLDSGSEALVVLDLALPAECPQPYPVGAVVTSVVPDVSRSATDSRFALYPDLGSIRFASCSGVG